MGKQLDQHGAVRYYWHGDEFWLDLIAQWKASGIGVRKFCEQNGAAASTLHKRRADLAKSEVMMPTAANVVTPDACFIRVMSDSVMDSAAPVTPPVVAAPTKAAVRDSVIHQRRRDAHRADRRSCRPCRATFTRSPWRFLMLIAGSCRAYVCHDLVEMRNGVDGLSYMVEPLLAQHPMSGHLFCLRRAPRAQGQILYWDRTGFALWYKQRERGRFPARESLTQRGLSGPELHAWLEGIDIPPLQPHPPVTAQRVA